MPFKLKNVGAPYQRLVNKLFKQQIGKNVEVYSDDMLVKSQVPQNHIKDLAKTFEVLKRHNMKLNPSKCAFRVSKGKFLSFIVTQKGIEANPKKIKAVLDMGSLRSKRDIQVLIGRIATLSRFMSKFAKRCLPFFKILKRNQSFTWTP